MRKIYFIILLFFVFQIQAQEKKGEASYYHSKFNGKKTATGDLFDNTLLTAASNTFKLGTKVVVTNLKNGKKVEVLINDRMSKYNKRLIDLSHEAARKIDMIKHGICQVKVEILQTIESD